MASTVSKFLIFSTHYVKKLSSLHFDAGSICRLFISSWEFLWLSLADILAPLVQPVHPQSKFSLAQHDSQEMWHRIWTSQKCSPYLARASVLNAHLFSIHLGWRVKNSKSPETLPRDSQAVLLASFPLRLHLWVLLAIVSIATIQLCHCSRKAVIDNT